jgi:GNAT superfamily N-acetyltransferase
MTTYGYRPIDAGDVELICSHREQIFLEAGHARDKLALMTRPYRPWLEAQLESRSYFGRVASVNDLDVGSIGWMTIGWPPHPLHPEQSQRGYVLNLFVEPAHRGRGVAKALMAAADADFRDHDIAYCILHATPAARAMYEKLGWKGTSEMARIVD